MARLQPFDVDPAVDQSGAESADDVTFDRCCIAPAEQEHDGRGRKVLPRSDAEVSLASLGRRESAAATWKGKPRGARVCVEGGGRARTLGGAGSAYCSRVSRCGDVAFASSGRLDQAAVDDVVHAGDVGRAVGGQHRDQRGDFLGRGEPPGRDC